MRGAGQKYRETLDVQPAGGVPRRRAPIPAPVRHHRGRRGARSRPGWDAGARRVLRRRHRHPVVRTQHDCRQLRIHRQRFHCANATPRQGRGTAEWGSGCSRDHTDMAEGGVARSRRRGGSYALAHRQAGLRVPETLGGGAARCWGQ